MDANTARISWRILAIVGGIASLVGLSFSIYGFRVALRRRILNQGTEKFVAVRDILMLGSYLAGSFIMIAVSIGLVWLSFHYSRDLDPFLETLAVPIFLCYLGFAGATAIFSMAGPIWVVSRYWALLDVIRTKEAIIMDTPKPKVAEWCETDPLVLLKNKHGNFIETHVTYSGFTTPEELRKIPKPIGNIVDGNLVVSIAAPPYVWFFSFMTSWEKVPYAAGNYGNISQPLAPGEAFVFTITLPN